MTKQIISYILACVCMLSSCREDYYEPDICAPGELLQLTVSVSDIVASGGDASRADDNRASTVFAAGDSVGLIILDAEGNLLADNLPYRFDGKKWDFYTDNTEGKQLVYYDAAMSTYIVYYPYHQSVDGITDGSKIVGLPAFAWRKNQNNEKDYRFSDPMVWSYTGEAKRQLDVQLKHIRNSLSLDVKLKWKISPTPNNEEGEYYEEVEEDFLLYRPRIDALKDFKIRYADGTPPILNLNNDDDSVDLTYHAEDTRLFHLRLAYQFKKSVIL